MRRWKIYGCRFTGAAHLSQAAPKLARDGSQCTLKGTVSGQGSFSPYRAALPVDRFSPRTPIE
jgi:hypothetical protein